MNQASLFELLLAILGLLCVNVPVWVDSVEAGSSLMCLDFMCAVCLLSCAVIYSDV